MQRAPLEFTFFAPVLFVIAEEALLNRVQNARILERTHHVKIKTSREKPGLIGARAPNLNVSRRTTNNVVVTAICIR
jgi:hypothetical protein